MILYTFSYHFCSGVDPGYNLRGCLSCEPSELFLMGVWEACAPKFLNVLYFFLPTDEQFKSGAKWVTAIELRLVCLNCTGGRTFQKVVRRNDVIITISV